MQILLQEFGTTASFSPRLLISLVQDLRASMSIKEKNISKYSTKSVNSREQNEILIFKYEKKIKFEFVKIKVSILFTHFPGHSFPNRLVE